MKFLIASDIHGSAYYCDLLLKAIETEKADRVLILGDILYHGPRNDLPKGHNPKEVARLLNEYKDEILCVKGNCEAEVDQLMLEFPVLAEYAIFFIDNKTLFLTHGHHYNPDNPPSFAKGSVLINGHTHISAIEENENFLYLNPGSVSLPKGNGINSYIVYENNIFTLKSLNGEVLKEINY